MKRVIAVDPANLAFPPWKVGDIVLVTGRQMRVTSIDVENGRATVED